MAVMASVSVVIVIAVVVVGMIGVAIVIVGAVIMVMMLAAHDPSRYRIDLLSYHVCDEVTGYAAMG